MNLKFFPRYQLVFCLLLPLFLTAGTNLAQVSISEESWVLPTYPVYPPDKNPMFFKGESYQGASRVIYPYALNDMISNEKTEKAWKAVVLENEYIKLAVTPEIGGKIYYGTDKTNDYNFHYRNNVVKPSNIGMTGAWVSGGIEWCVIHHHRASTYLPVDYHLAENSDGSKTIWIGETEPRHQMRWTIGITMFPGKSYYQAEVKIHNPTPYTNTFLYWANVAAHTNENYQVIFPPSVDTVTYHAKNSFARWPVATEIYNGRDFRNGVDISWWKNSIEQNSYFAYDLQEDFMGGYDHGKEAGTVHVGDHNIVKGAKLWEWGSGERGQATEARLTDNDGPYVEIMVGAFSDNQPDYSWIRPYEVKSFKQYWYPVKDIRGFKNANLNGAVNLEKEGDDQAFLGYYSTCKIEKARIILKKNDTVVFEKTVEISPESPFTGSVKIDGPFELADLYTEIINLENNEVLVSCQPVQPAEKGELPEEVQKPAPPEEIKTTEELYLAGSRILQFHNPTLDAMDYFEEALKRDPDDIRSNIAVGNIHLKNWEYAAARKYFDRAVKRLTRDHTRPSDCEAFYLLGLTLKDLELYEESVDALYRATWDYAWHSAAYLELARISSLRGDYRKALEQVNQSLSTNSNNNSALDLKASLQRKLGDFIGAKSTIEPLLENDPLDFRAGNELYLVEKESGNSRASDRLLLALGTKMRDFGQNYLDLAAGYLSEGLYTEAEDVLNRFPGKNQEVGYYLGYLQDKKGNRNEAGTYFREASEMPVDYGFPFRRESLEVLELAARYDPADARPGYYLGNLLFDRQPEKAIGCWEKAVALDPSLATAWRNLGWGYYHHCNDIPRAIGAYEKALAVTRDEPVYYSELDPLYEMNNTPIATRAKLFESANEVVKKRDDAFVRQILVLNLAGESEKAVEYLSTSNFHFREGSSRVRDITVDARLLLGKKHLEQSRYDQALEQFLALIEDPGDAGSGRGDQRSPQVNYFIGLAYEAMGNNAEAESHFRMSADQALRNIDFVSYYQGLSYLKIGNKTKADEIFTALTEEGSKRMNQGSEVDFFAKFGERETASVQLSNANLLLGLGSKGLGNTGKARETLQKAVNLSASNLWAAVELGSMER